MVRRCVYIIKLVLPLAEAKGMSTLALVGPQGYRGKIIIDLTDEEVEKMKASADALKAVISQIEI